MANCSSVSSTMSTIQKGNDVWLRTKMDTPFDAVCVKSRNPSGDFQFGKLTNPPLTVGTISEIKYREIAKTRGECDLLDTHEGEVVVLGSPLSASEEMWVWRGTLNEFNSQWMID